MFEKILIANRGEIACRIMDTARKKGIKTVAVYSVADATSRHVRLADEAYEIGAAEASKSYLNADAIIKVAKKSGAEAIHPGYGFLSENADFADKCEKNNIRFIGPTGAAIRLMGLKDKAKEVMASAGVPVVPGYDGDNQDEKFLKNKANDIGYPLLIKAVAGGGGKGMRLVEREDDFLEALKSAKREAKSSFANDQVLLEKYLSKSRHIEVQVFADMVGNAVYLHERDCSLQRRHQKVVEEAPAPDLSDDMRYEIGETAIKAVKAIKYRGAGTIEFIVDVEHGLKDAPFYFMEMNTRLQVEHPVTELITGLDLVEWQLRIGAGERLPLNQKDIKLHGHAFEVRLYAEDPDNEFLPQTGILNYFTTPPISKNFRLDTGIEQGDGVSIYYDPMIAKLIVWGESRSEALRHMRKALKDTAIAGLKTNLEFLYNIFDHQAFNVADFDTSFIDKYTNDLINTKKSPSVPVLVLSALSELMPHNQGHDIWDRSDGWLLNLNLTVTINLVMKNQTYDIGVTYLKHDFNIEISGKIYHVNLLSHHQNELTLLLDGTKTTGKVIKLNQDLTVFYEGSVTYLHHYIPGADRGDDHDEDGSILAPMPGKIQQIFVKNGQAVIAGQALLVLEAMKMEHTLKAPFDGTVKDLSLSADIQVSDGQILLKINQGDHNE